MAIGTMKSSSKLAWCLALLSLLLYGYLGYVELAVRHDRPVQIDELFFATCAARATQLGQLFSSGCHDNKGPVIYVVYGALHWLAGIYNYTAYKVCALLLGLLLLAGLAWLAAASLLWPLPLAPFNDQRIFVAALVAAFSFGHLLIGVGACIGLALGILNFRLIGRSVDRVTEMDTDGLHSVMATPLIEDGFVYSEMYGFN